MVNMSFTIYYALYKCFKTGSPFEKETTTASLAKPEAQALCQDSESRRKKVKWTNI